MKLAENKELSGIRFLMRVLIVKKNEGKDWFEENVNGEKHKHILLNPNRTFYFDLTWVKLV